MRNSKRPGDEGSKEEPSRKRLAVLTDINLNVQTQRPKSKRKYQEPSDDEEIVVGSQPNGVVSNKLAGAVEKVYLRNFMCHTALEINFNKQINFVIGRNGSGKSAILTSLVVGLGGRATDTNRGKSIKGFIKTGESQCAIEIVINNEGLCAYYPEQYGQKITIIRSITGSTSSYRIKSASGQIVSTSGKEVTRICDALNIQVNNPVCILNQDTSRNFLNSSDPKRKYLLFMRATNLENINDYYKVISQERQVLSDKLTQKQEAFAELKHQMKKWESKLKMIESVEEFKAELENLDQELFWSKHRNLQNQLNSKKAAVEKANQQLKKLVEKASTTETNEEAIVEKLREINQQIGEITNEIRNIERDFQELRLQQHELRDALNKKRNELNLKSNLTQRRVNEHDTQNQLLNQMIQTADLIAAKRLKLKNDIDELGAQLTQIEATIKTSSMELEHRRGSIKNYQDEEYKLKSTVTEIENNISQKRGQIRSLKRETNTLSLYGPNMAQCLEMIAKEKNKFTEVPRGPLGMYIKVRDKKWASAVELYLKHGLLKTFCVTNSHDQKILSNIFDRVFRNSSKPSIISSKFFHMVHDVSRKRVRPPDGLMSLQDVLEISDPVVENCLIDQQLIETILLLPSDDEAMRLLANEENVPRNCKKGFTIKGDIYIPAPDYKSYATKFKPATLLQASTQTVISQFENDIRELEEKKVETASKIKEFRQKFTDQMKSLQQQEAQVNELRKNRIKLQNQKVKLEYEMDPVDQTTDFMMTELEELKRKVDEAKRDEDRCRQEFQELEQKVEAEKENLDGFNNTLRALNQRLQPLEEQKLREEVKLREYKTNNEIQQQKLQDIKLILKQCKAGENEINKIVKEHLKDRPPTEIEDPRSETEIEHLRKSLQKSIQNVNSQKDDPAHVREMYHKCREKYVGTQQMLKLLIKNLDLLTNTIDQRLNNYSRIVKRVGRTVEKMFHNVLQIRQYQGHIKIDHDKKELEIHVKTQNNQSNNGDTRTLSGGERSYATVAFIMALWRCVKFPFYFMDEFDVFMDKVNRRTIMDLLLQHANEHSECQYVFLTPQDISNIESRPELTIHRMSDPKRD